MPTLSELQSYLDALVARHETDAFIAEDPISIPHTFDDPADQAVIGFYAALLAWGRRDVMLRKLEELCARMDYAPHCFVRSFDEARDAPALDGFVHRTFQPIDALWLTKNLSAALDRYGSMEGLFAAHEPDDEDKSAGRSPAGPMLQGVSTTLLMIDDDTPQRLRKHLASETGAALSDVYDLSGSDCPVDGLLEGPLSDSLLKETTDSESDRYQ